MPTLTCVLPKIIFFQAACILLLAVSNAFSPRLRYVRITGKLELNASNRSLAPEEDWWGRGGPPQKIPSPGDTWVSKGSTDNPGTTTEKRGRRYTNTYKHLFRNYFDPGTEEWLSTIDATNFFLSCNYTTDEIKAIGEEFPPALTSLSVRGHLVPKLRFLISAVEGDDSGDPWCGGANGTDFCASDLVKSVPPQFFGLRLERTVAPRHAYLSSSSGNLPHGRELLLDDCRLLKEFLMTCGKSTAEFAALCCRWERERAVKAVGTNGLATTHNVERVEAFERRFCRGLLAASRNEVSEDWKLAECEPGEMVELLIQHGANPREVDTSGASLLHWAAGTGNLEGAKALLDIMAKMDGRLSNSGALEVPSNVVLNVRGAKDGATPLHWACCGVGPSRFGIGGHVDICRLFLKKTSDRLDDLVNVRTMTGNTPLMWASWSGSVSVMEFLVSRGADPHARNANGCNAAHWAASGGHLDSCHYLQELGVDFTLEITMETHR